MKKISPENKRDISWFLSVRKIFDFDGVNQYCNKKGIDIIQPDKKGIDGINAFYLYDSQGIIKKTKHPNILQTLLKTKGSCNLHIKMFAEDRAAGTLSKPELIAFCKKINAPEWFYEAVEKQKIKYWK